MSTSRNSTVRLYLTKRTYISTLLHSLSVLSFPNHVHDDVSDLVHAFVKWSAHYSRAENVNP